MSFTVFGQNLETNMTKDLFRLAIRLGSQFTYRIMQMFGGYKSLFKNQFSLRVHLDQSIEKELCEVTGSDNLIPPSYWIKTLDMDQIIDTMGKIIVLVAFLTNRRNVSSFPVY